MKPGNEPPYIVYLQARKRRLTSALEERFDVPRVMRQSLRAQAPLVSEMGDVSTEQLLRELRALPVGPGGLAFTLSRHLAPALRSRQLA
jgi:hypothetical protein